MMRHENNDPRAGQKLAARQKRTTWRLLAVISALLGAIALTVLTRLFGSLIG